MLPVEQQKHAFRAGDMIPFYMLTLACVSGYKQNRALTGVAFRGCTMMDAAVPLL